MKEITFLLEILKLIIIVGVIQIILNSSLVQMFITVVKKKEDANHKFLNLVKRIPTQFN